MTSDTSAGVTTGLTTFLQAALNGDRVHPAAPRTPAAIAHATRAAVNAGAASVHVHAFDDAGRETLDGGTCARVLRAIRAGCPGTPISLTTSASIVPDPLERLRIVEARGSCPTRSPRIRGNRASRHCVSCCCREASKSRLDC